MTSRLARGSLLTVLLVAAVAAIYAYAAGEATPTIKGWKKGVGWGWIWGKDDEVGSLNAMDAKSIKAALQLAKEGKVYDLGITYSRNSYKWPGHSPGEVLT